MFRELPGGRLRGSHVAACLLPDLTSVLPVDPFEDELLESDDDNSSVDLDKVWHGLHWLLVRSDAPIDEAVFGGEELGDDLGYGPSRLLSAERSRRWRRPSPSSNPTSSVPGSIR